jgi:hypothetical protein
MSPIAHPGSPHQSVRPGSATIPGCRDNKLRTTRRPQRAENARERESLMVVKTPVTRKSPNSCATPQLMGGASKSSPSNTPSVPRSPSGYATLVESQNFRHLGPATSRYAALQGSFRPGSISCEVPVATAASDSMA